MSVIELDSKVRNFKKMHSFNVFYCVSVSSPNQDNLKDTLNENQSVNVTDQQFRQIQLASASAKGNIEAVQKLLDKG